MTGTVGRLADWPPPHRISESDFEVIVSTFRIAGRDHPWLREILDELTDTFAKIVRDERALPDRRADRKHMEAARKAIERARYEIRLAHGPVARAALGRAAGELGALVSTTWLRAQFPGDPLAPAPHYWPEDDRGPSPSRRPARPIEIDQLSIEARVRFAERRGRELIEAALAVLAANVAAAHQQIVTPEVGKTRRGGRKPQTVRHYFLINLVHIWRRLGRHPAMGNSDFTDFAEAVCEAAGEPSAGLVAALARAIRAERA